MQERRIDDYWNIDGSRDSSDSWKGFNRFTLSSEKPPERHMWSGERLAKRQATSRPDHSWPELWRGMSKNAKLRSINGLLKNQCSIMQEDYEESISLTLRTWSSRKSYLKMQPMAPAMPCKTCKKSKHGETRGQTNDFKSKFACILEASESTRLRKEESLPNYHEDQIAERGDNSLQHYNLVHKFIPMPQAMKIPAAKAAVDK